MLLAAGTVGEVGPIVAASLVLSSRFSTWQEFVLLAAFLALFLLTRGLPAWLYRRDLPRSELAPPCCPCSPFQRPRVCCWRVCRPAPPPRRGDISQAVAT